jgi:hypothetical protein
VHSLLRWGFFGHFYRGLRGLSDFADCRTYGLHKIYIYVLSV